jgi:hypothetical protein
MVYSNERGMRLWIVGYEMMCVGSRSGWEERPGSVCQLRKPKDTSSYLGLCSMY